MSRQATKKKKRAPSPHHQREQLADAGDLRGFLEHLVVSESELINPNTGSQLTRCLKTRSRDVDGMCEDGFALSIELAVGLLSRVNYVIHTGLQRHDDGGRPLRGIPNDLLPWLDRAERLSRFIAEMSTARARVQHLQQLAGTGDDFGQTKSRRKRAARSLAHSNGHAHRNGNSAADRNGKHRLVEVLEES